MESGDGGASRNPAPSLTGANPVRLQTVLAEIEGARLRLEAVLGA